MSTNAKSLKYLEDIKINVKIKLSALWVTLMLFYIYADILGFYSPGVIEKVVSGEIGGMQITEIFLFSMAVWMAIPSVMVFLSLALKAKANRVINIIAGSSPLLHLSPPSLWGSYPFAISSRQLSKECLWYGLSGMHGSGPNRMLERL